MATKALRDLPRNVANVEPCTSTSHLQSILWSNSTTCSEQDFGNITRRCSHRRQHTYFTYSHECRLHPKMKAETRGPYLERHIRKVREQGININDDVEKLMLRIGNKFELISDLAKTVNEFLVSHPYKAIKEKPRMKVDSDAENQTGTIEVGDAYPHATFEFLRSWAGSNTYCSSLQMTPSHSC
ncbi:hypothetical protein KP509_16G052300 [Ceratopteris richardii]|uniref:Uncharacterized protein n=1 Tax=Ceratopteris richardii TaxID=49495 RepID=A0A8T2SYV6_CERRI|nr:hypothetical protein KP509_16G052300 [Ceratopteris richardii]